MRKTQTDDSYDQKTELEQIGICDHVITSLILGRNNLYTSLLTLRV